MNTTSHIIRRAKRTALAEELADARILAATQALRSLSAGTTPPAEARLIADRYCRVMHMAPAGEALLDYLCSAESALVPIEDIDGLLMVDGENAYAMAHAAITRARRLR